MKGVSRRTKDQSSRHRRIAMDARRLVEKQTHLQRMGEGGEDCMTGGNSEENSGFQDTTSHRQLKWRTRTRVFIAHPEGLCMHERTLGIFKRSNVLVRTSEENSSEKNSWDILRKIRMKF